MRRIDRLLAGAFIGVLTFVAAVFSTLIVTAMIGIGPGMLPSWGFPAGAVAGWIGYRRAEAFWRWLEEKV